MSHACTSGRLGFPAGAAIVSRPSERSLLMARRQHKMERRQQGCVAGMGIGFTSDNALAVPSQELLMPNTPDYGLSAKQMQVLGLTNQPIGARLPEVDAVG